MSNDLIRLAMERAVKLYSDKGDGLFNGAWFSQAFCKLAGLAAGAALDGYVVRAMLTGRGDVEPLKGGGHYRLLPDGPPALPLTSSSPAASELIDKFVADLQRAPGVISCRIAAKQKAGGHRVKLTVYLGRASRKRP